MRFINLDYFIRNICSSLGDPEAQKTYVPILREVKQSLDYLNLFILPDIKSTRIKVESNFTAHMPSNTIKPIQCGRIIVSASGQECLYPLQERTEFGFRSDILIPSPGFGCPETTESSIASDDCFCYENLNGFEAGMFNYMPWYYGEFYGYSPNIAFGYWAYDKNNNRIAFDYGGCVSEGDIIAVKYETDQYSSESALIPVDCQMVLRYHVLMNYWANANPGKSQYYLNLFRRANRDLKHKTLDQYYMEIVNAITSGYRSSV